MYHRGTGNRVLGLPATCQKIRNDCGPRGIRFDNQAADAEMDKFTVEKLGSLAGLNLFPKLVVMPVISVDRRNRAGDRRTIHERHRIGRSHSIDISDQFPHRRMLS